MRKVDDGEKKKKRKEENNDVYSGHYVIASRPPDRRPTGTPHARANWDHLNFKLRLRLTMSQNVNLLICVEHYLF